MIRFPYVMAFLLVVSTIVWMRFRFSPLLAVVLVIPIMFHLVCVAAYFPAAKGEDHPHQTK